jgi:serine/threonine protein kinase/Tol biopolymer transport system component
MNLSPNSPIGDYTIVSKIGEGGMGEVWRARDAKLGRDVAIKVLPAAFSSDAERLRRFEQEAQAAGALNHPNILVIYHIGTHNESPYIVSELLEGETLRERMGGVALPQRKAIDYALQAAHGLAAAHEKGIIHRDLKPENLFITKDGRVKILDFGLAKLLGNDSNQAQTEIPTRRVDTDPGVVMGTIGYMSPEQLRGRAADHRSDIFSFGAILYEMLSGRRAFRGESTADTMSAILREDPPELSATNKSVAPALERVVNHCLEKNPEERFHSANDLGFAIEALSGSGTMSDSTATRLHALPATKRNRRELIAWALAGAGFLGLLVVLGLSFRRQEVNAKPMRFVIAMPDKVSEITFPIISPDGNTIAFLGSLESRRMLFVRGIDSLDAKVLEGTEDASFPFWSPDGRQLAFFSQSKLKKIEVNGGPPQVLCDAPGAGGGAWNRNGLILFGGDAKPIQRVSAAAGGDSKPVLQLDESRKESSQFWPYFLPDGKHFLYQSWTGRSEDTAIFVTSIDGGERKLLVMTDSNVAYASTGYLLFARSTTLLAQPFDTKSLTLSGEPIQISDQVTFTDNFSLSNFSISDTNVLVFCGGAVSKRQLTWFDRSGKQLELVGPPAQYNDVVLAPDEKHVAVQNVEGNNSDLWTIDLTRNLPSRLTFEGGEDDPVWSADGNTLIFSVSSGGPFDIYKRPSNGGGKAELVSKTPESKEGSDWSRDGKYVLMDNYDNHGNLDLWVLPMFGDGKPYPLLNSPFLEGQGHFSPDGQWFAYTCNESGRSEVYLRHFPDCDKKVQVSTGGGAQPHWRKDGRELFYIASDRNLMAVDVNLGKEAVVGTAKALFLTNIVRFEAPNRYAVAGDGQRFLINTKVEKSNTTPITVLLNWTEALKKVD